jgi:hypothetical protein
LKLKPKVGWVFADKAMGPESVVNGHQRNMSFKSEMDIFFMRNCCSDNERSKIKAWHQYKVAKESNDVTHAQEIAMQVMEGKIANFQD